MHALYEQLQKDGKTGPFMKGPDDQLVPRPDYQSEYPKWVTDADGKRVIVKDLREEAKVAGKPQTEVAPDPLAAEREKLSVTEEALAKERQELETLKAEMKEQLSQLAAQRAIPSGNAPSPAQSARAKALGK